MMKWIAVHNLHGLQLQSVALSDTVLLIAHVSDSDSYSALQHCCYRELDNHMDEYVVLVSGTLLLPLSLSLSESKFISSSDSRSSSNSLSRSFFSRLRDEGGDMKDDDDDSEEAEGISFLDFFLISTIVSVISAAASIPVPASSSDETVNPEWFGEAVVTCAESYLEEKTELEGLSSLKRTMGTKAIRCSIGSDETETD
ncbi:hypothetical protein BCR41DRAFT_374207 [Lobosporangium transversale]|uniref:Uncharacterized protein n=1 Tax=Lobosporangium transversale TaxID=64571 RepID=A0A1Y2GBF6_9FUNG|nr:hypothetical protein BCR41DRAFT_374207 [Lobosporangium transversale]ORZ06175.1 hypothetical protein BCR41DRAFT_374207 [Lobosporangium transversale]|eukprot:XP_021877444.1 hypothetical protein BCR41DRAFT_374207 [Lobosporangium transversale]